VRLTLVNSSYQKINSNDFIFIFTELRSKFSGGGGGGETLTKFLILKG
jgi:hypothetical protein